MSIFEYDKEEEERKLRSRVMRLDIQWKKRNNPLNV